MRTDPVLAYIAQHPGCTAAEIRAALDMHDSDVYSAARDLVARGSITTSLVRPPYASRHVKSFHAAQTQAAPQSILIPPPTVSAQRFRVRTTVDLTIGGHTIPMDLSEIRDLVAGLQEVLAQHAN